MRFCRTGLPFALLALAAACGTGGNSSAQWNTMLDPTAHDSFFPIVAGSAHALGSDSPAITCNSCHGGASTFTQFDCLSCHQHSDQAALALGHRGVPQYAYASASCYSCHARGTAGGAVPSGAIGDPAQDLTVNAQIPSYVDTSISSLRPQAETLPMPMDHGTTHVDAAAFASCGTCHVNAGAGSYYPGNLHSSLANLNLAQPSGCLDCHASSKPIGFVGPTATNPVRTPASGEMKHDAVLWSNGLPTAASAVPQDCAVCHVTPSMSMSGAWGINQAGTTPALFHASLTAANLPQPASCVDCHANSRPAVLLTSANAALPANVQFDHSVAEALGDCTSCHMNGGATQWTTSWSGGQFHLAGDPTPATCLPCHDGERPTTTVNAPSGWITAPSATKPFDTVTNSLGIGHGDDQDCATCHSGPGTGTWGGSQNWAKGLFTHGPSTDSSTTCIACHSTQRPAFQLTPTNSALPSNATPLCAGVATACFDHSTSGTGDCIGCHEASVSYTNYGYSGSPSPHFSGGNWAGGVGYPADTLAASQSQYITLTETTLNPSPPSLVTSTSSITTKLNNAMLHHRAQWTCAKDGTRTCTVDADCTVVGGQCLATVLDAGDAAHEDTSKCALCHTVSSPGVITGPGQFHSVLTTSGFQQPAINCFDCHQQMRPTGIVEKAASDLQPMDHNAVFNAPVTINGVSVGGVAAMDCSDCHASPGNTWSDGLFHKNIAAAVPKDCTVCHYPLMVDAAKADLTSGVNYAMRHTSGQITFQNCQTCHTGALAKGKNTPIAATLWQTGAFHASLASQPSACVACHVVSEPAANASTRSSLVYNLTMGGTSTNMAQWMNHGSNSVAGKDCFVCHAADAKTSGSAWSKSDSFHGAVSSPSSCRECHGLTNGGGSVAGTNNNLPVGLTNSSTVTSAAADAAAGIPAGTYDQITHTDINVSSHDCNFCHTQKGVSTVAGVQGREWAQAAFHANFTSANPLVMNGTTGRCSNCHMNTKPGATFTAFDHSTFSATSGTQDCSSCHSWPGTGTATASNWLGAAAAPAIVTLTGWTSGTSITSNTVTFSHPSPSTYTSCAQCHAGSNYSTIIDFNHDGLTSNVTINGVTPSTVPNLGTSIYDVSTNPTFCVACHNSASPWVSRTGLSSTITANTTSGSTTVTTPSTGALTLGMTISGTGIPSNTTTTTTLIANITSGSTTVTTSSPVSLSAGTIISGTGIPANDTVATSVNNATSFTLKTAATATTTGVTLTATKVTPLTVTIKTIPNATSLTISTAANATTTGTTLSVTHMSTRQASIGSHGGSTNGQDCTSCHYVGGRDRLTPPTPGVFATGTISGN